MRDDGRATSKRGRGAARLRIALMLRVGLMLAPAFVVIGGLFVGGLAFALRQSLGYFPAMNESAFTLAHYRFLFADAEVRRALVVTCLLASVATVISAALGLACAVLLREVASRNRVVNLLLQIPLAVPHLVVGVVLLDLLAPSGLVARLAFACGFIDAPADFPALTNDSHGIGIVAAYVVKETPFILVTTLAVLTRADRDYDQAARTLGAGSWQRLRFVTLPIVAPAVVSSSLLVLAFIFGAFEIPVLLGRTYPAMLSVVAQRRFLGTDLAERPDAIAVAVLLAFVAGVFVLLYMRLARLLVGVDKPTLFT